MIQAVDPLSLEPVQPKPRFAVGQIVRHRRHGYRGVIVAVDATCQASAEWYLSNQTQPSQDQPWYHVLVDRSQQATYACQGNLEASPDVSPVFHPLIDVYFERYDVGGYVRNARAWPGW
ncbi:MAG: heat shock protein HspQ [Planctomycetales bacterium]